MGRRQRKRERRARPQPQLPGSMADLAGIRDKPAGDLAAMHTLLASEHTSLTGRMIVPGTRAEPRPGISDEQWELMSGRYGEVEHMMGTLYDEIGRR